MRRLVIPAFGIETTAVGFGCSSLAGRLSEKEALALIASALDAGVRHFDVARSYGGGASERLLGKALGARRNEVTITSKFGLLIAERPALIGLARRALRPMVKFAAGMAGMRQASRSTGASSLPEVDFSPESASLSLDASLRALNTDRLDLFLLHEARAGELHDDRLLDFLTRAQAAGKIRGFGVGTERANFPALLATRPQYCPVAQHEWSVLTGETALPQSKFRITHGALFRSWASIQEAVRRDPSLARECEQATGEFLEDPARLSALLLRSAALRHPGSIVLFSARQPSRIAHNVAALNDASLDASCERFQRFMNAHRERFNP